MKTHLTFTMLLFLTSISAACARRSGDECSRPPEINESLPGVLIIGDSISLGYTPVVQAALLGADTVHSICNDMSSGNGVANVATWIGYRKHWSVVTFNHGFWDIPARTGPQQSQATSLTAYAANLRAEGTYIKDHADHVIFILSTEVSPEWAAFTNQDVLDRNDTARTVMQELGIPVLDLNAVSAPINGTEHDSSLIHWTASGYETLGTAVAGAVRTAL